MVNGIPPRRCRQHGEEIEITITVPRKMIHFWNENGAVFMLNSYISLILPLRTIPMIMFVRFAPDLLRRAL